ncbi:MAG: Trk system potassium transporter TrkA, partial [Deltaproteobacteria bacterium]|nr:Trk system potassium transporter TrkA [Deltaproteobacteria bacterium]
KLSREKVDVVLVDVAADRLAEISDTLDVQTIEGPICRPAVLEEAGLKDAELLVAVTSSDESNILACRLSQILAPSVRRVARVRDPRLLATLSEADLRSGLGLDFIIDPTSLTVDTIMDFIDLPGAVDVIDVASGRLKLIGLRLPQNHKAIGSPLSVVLPRGEGANLLAVAVYRHQQVLIPTGATVLRARDLVYMAATGEHLAEVGLFFGLEWRTVKRIFILGGGDVGLALARRLEARRLEARKDLVVKLIEQNQERCEFLSRELAKTIVLRGDATDEALLSNEGIDECDAFIAVGTDDEKNMVSCLLAKRMGAASTITRVNRYSYAPLVSAIGLESLVSARVAAVSAILKYIRKGLVVTVATLRNEDSEIAEMTVTEDSKMAGKPLMAVKFPSGAIIAGILRESAAIIPKGDTVIEPGDTLVVVARSETVPLLEKALV